MTSFPNIPKEQSKQEESFLISMRTRMKFCLELYLIFSFDSNNKQTKKVGVEISDDAKNKISS